MATKALFAQPSNQFISIPSAQVSQVVNNNNPAALHTLSAKLVPRQQSGRQHTSQRETTGKVEHASRGVDVGADAGGWEE